MAAHRIARCTRVRAAALVLLASASSAVADTLYVRASGSDQADGRTAQTAFRTLQRAAQALNHGDGIVAGPGEYRETVFLAERFAANGATMSIAGDESGRLTGDAPGPVVVVSDSAATPALHVYRFRNVTVSGLTFRGRGQGLKVERSVGAVVERCTFDGLARGLAVANSEDVRIESCVVARCGLGLALQGVVRARIAHCTVVGAGTAGILALGCGEGAVVNCLLAANNTSLVADRVSAAAWTSDRNVLHGTTGPWGDGPAVANAHEWFGASGQDRHSVHVVPEFADAAAWNLRPAPGVTWGGGLPGMRVGVRTDPAVTHDRDGRPFRAEGAQVCVGAYDYPEPVPSGPWRRLDARPRSDGVRQSAGIYRRDDTLVRMLLADATGVAALWWDGLDDIGQPVPAGDYEVRSVAHDVRVVDDGAFGDDGNPLGAFNCDNADRVVPLPDGGFVVSTPYDEAGFALRAYAASGQPLAAANLAEKDILALACDGESVYAAVGKPPATALQRFTRGGDRLPLAGGPPAAAILAAGETNDVAGLAVIGARACAAIAGCGEVRVFDLATGQRTATWAVPAVADIAAEGGTLWAIAGRDVVALDPATGVIARRQATTLAAPRYLAAVAGRLAVVDRANARLALLEAADGKVLKTLGRDRPAGAWLPVGGDLLRDPRGCAFLPTGQLVLTEQGRVRILWPESGVVAREMLSNFMDVAVVHPLRKEYVYCWNMSVFRVDPATGAWREAAEGPVGMVRRDAAGRDVPYRYPSPSLAAVLGGRPFVAVATQEGRLWLFDVSEPERPRLALETAHPLLRLHPYSIVSFGPGGDLIANADSYGLSFTRIPFRGLDERKNPRYDFDAATTVGPPKDPEPRGMKCVNAPSADPTTGDIYYLAVTARNCKMVPGWGADGTGVGKSAPDGRPLWFSASSGGNYMSGATVRDAHGAWYLAGKSFGGQIDLFDPNGLRLATGNWAWPCHYQIGFVDLRYGVNPYVRPDGRIGAYIEDDAIGRFGRLRVDGAETLHRATAALAWRDAAAQPGELPDAGRTLGRPPVTALPIPRVPPLALDHGWKAWAVAGVVPQVLMLPVPGFRRNLPTDLWQTFRAGTAIGAAAHDGENLYVHFVVADDSPHFDATDPARVWMYDGIELWIEEEQFGLAFCGGKPTLYKFRHHGRDGKPWSAGYALPPENVHGEPLASLAAHPLGRQLADATGVSFEGKKGYVLAGRIPLAEVRLVGGIAGRSGQDNLPATGAAGETLRIGVAIGAISAWGREQDYKINWPCSLMFADPTRSMPFVFAP